MPLGLSRAEGRMREFNFFVADSWRVGPSLTVSAGLRYVLQLPFYPTNNSYTTVERSAAFGRRQLFKPGTRTRPVFDQVSRRHLRLQHR